MSNNIQHVLLRVALAAMMACSISQIQAATIIVDTIQDDSLINGNCTLREAINATNLNIAVDACTSGDPGGDTIRFDATVSGTILLTNNPSVITEELTIEGPGAETLTISADNTYWYVFEVDSPTDDQTVSISGLTLIGASNQGILVWSGDNLNLSASVVRGNSGAGISLVGQNVAHINSSTLNNNTDGGLRNGYGSVVSVEDSIISGNSADQWGGIYNYVSDLTLINTEVIDNHATVVGGGVNNLSGTLTVINSVIRGNTAQAAAGIYNVGMAPPCQAMIMDSVIQENVADFSGGGILNHDGCELSIIDSSITGNTAQSGGGIEIYQNGKVMIQGSTFSGNVASGGFGGGISNNHAAVTITNSTFSGNQATNQGGAIFNFNGEITLLSSTFAYNSAGSGGGLFNRYGRTYLTNTIVALNDVNDCALLPPSPSFPVSEIISQGYNLDSDDSCGLTAIGDIPATDPLLDALADNGGLTATHALLPGSPAIDAGDYTVCPPTDQRGVARPQDGDTDGIAVCDIGAYEFAPDVLTIQIDIKPNSDPNSVTVKAKGVIPVAILSTNTSHGDATDFDALQVDPQTVRFGPDQAQIAHQHGHVEDVDDDGDYDLMMHFRVGQTGIVCGDNSAQLTGSTYGGLAIQGYDTIRTVGCK